MMKFLPLSLLVGLTLFLSCTDFDDNLSGTQIRVRNSSDISLDEVTIGDLMYEGIDKGEETFYKKYDPDQMAQIMAVTTDSLEFEELFNLEVDSVNLQLFTFQIDTVSVEKGLKFTIQQD